MMKKNIFVFITFLLLFSGLTQASTPLSIDADIIRSSDHTKTWTVPFGGGGGGGANTNLSNLTSPTAINQTLFPSGSIDIGSVGAPFNNVYGSTVITPTLAIPAGGGNVIIQGNPSQSTNNTFFWPATVGTAGQFLSTDGNVPATLSWTTASGGSSNPNVVGTSSSPISITASGGISFSGTNPSNVIYVKGSGGSVTITATPSIQAGNVDGQRLTVRFTSTSNAVTIHDKSTLSGSGTNQNGDIVGVQDRAIVYMWDATALEWFELSRR